MQMSAEDVCSEVRNCTTGADALTLPRAPEKEASTDGGSVGLAPMPSSADMVAAPVIVDAITTPGWAWV